jgi:hypothetical protein
MRHFLTVAIVVAAALLVFEVYCRWLKRRGGRVVITELVPYIRGAAAMGLDGSRMRIEREGSDYFIDFEKIAPPSGPEGLRMVVYEQSCSPQEFKAVEIALQEVGVLSFNREDRSGRKCIVVNCGMDVLLAARAVRALWVKAWGFGMDEKVRVWNKGPFPYRAENLKKVP